jgi:hypothetical protein
MTLGSLPPGLNLNSASGAISGTPTTATGSPFTFTVQATDSTSPTAQTATANLSITVTVAPLVITTTNLQNAVVNTSYNQTLTFTGGTNPVTWAVTTGTLPVGLVLNATNGNISGTPTTAGTSNFTVTATDSTTPTPQTANANLSITVSAAAACGPGLGGSEAFLSGGYAFLLKGFDNSGNPALVGGVLTFNGSGGITAGAMDMNLNSGVQTNLSVISASSSYRVTSDQRGCMVIATSAGTQNFRFSLGNIAGGVASTGHVINFDTTGPFTAGVLRKQSSGSFTAATVTGSYAFGASSIQNAAVVSGGVAGGRFGVVGELSFNGSGGITGGSEDFNQNGTLDGSAANTNWPASPITISGGTYTVSSNGRGTLAITVTGVTGTFHDVLYVVSSSEALFMTSDPQTAGAILAGQALLQSGAPFAANPLSGAYVGYQSGLNTSGTSPVSRTTLLLLTASGINITGNQLRNDGGSFQSKSIGTGITYSVAPSGRMIVSGGGGGGGPIFYLVSPNQAFAVGTGSTVDTGFFQSQTGGPFTNASATGTYAFGTIEPVLANPSDDLGVATFTPATTTINVIDDQNGNGSQNLGVTQSFNYSIDPTGLGTIPSSGSSCTISATSTTCQTVIYIISPTKAVIMDTQSSNPKIQLGDK